MLALQRPLHQREILFIPSDFLVVEMLQKKNTESYHTNIKLN